MRKASSRNAGPIIAGLGAPGLRIVHAFRHLAHLEDGGIGDGSAEVLVEEAVLSAAGCYHAGAVHGIPDVLAAIGAAALRCRDS